MLRLLHAQDSGGDHAIASKAQAQVLKSKKAAGLPRRPFHVSTT